MVNSGILYPEDLAVLAQAVDDFCREFRIKPDSDECPDETRKAVTMYEHGCRGRDELVAKLREQSTSAANTDVARSADPGALPSAFSPRSGFPESHFGSRQSESL